VSDRRAKLRKHRVDGAIEERRIVDDASEAEPKVFRESIR